MSSVATPTGQFRRRASWAIALGVDALQLGLLPVTGTLSTWVDAPLDVITGAALWALLGWHWAFLPTFLVELLPFVEVVPSWTLAVWIVTRSGGSPPVLPGNPQPPLQRP